MIDQDAIDAMVGRVITQLAAEGRICPTEDYRLAAIAVLLDSAGMIAERIYATLLYALDQLDADIETGTDGHLHLV